VASYARQYNDKTLLEHCYEIRNRAKRRMGELLTKTPQQRGGDTRFGREVSPTVKGRVAVAKRAGISEHDRKSAMRVAAMPEKEFERRVKDPSLGQRKKVPGSFRCPHCGGLIVR
jgi:hypothetical protein